MNPSDLVVSDTTLPTPYHTGRGSARKAENRDFVAWDGEGITPAGETQQNYVLFGNSLGFEVTAGALSTLECLELILATEIAYPLSIHVGFAFNYDTEMILGDLSLRHMHVLHRKGSVRWNGYRIEYRRGKWLQVSKRHGDALVVARVWDVWSFFGTSFVRALEEYLGNDPEVEYIAQGKKLRKIFTYDDLEPLIRPYWQAELRCLVRLMNSLRERLYGAGLRITNWHGPGAIATYAMRQRGTKSVMATAPEEVREAARFAYAGGRFELFQVGRHVDRVYGYDIRSAYPAAIARLPNLAEGKWEHVVRPDKVETFGMYHIKFTHPNLFTTRPMPFPFRDRHAAVHFPNVVEGWYWSPEAKFADYLGGEAEIVDGWVFRHNGDRPFAWIEEIYEQRAQWKREGNPCQVALKLLMNSMYGKFAQRVGSKGLKPPAWHQLEWAGYITSYTRAKLFAAMMEAHAKNALVAVETDGIFTTEPLTHSVEIGPRLGQWEVEQWDEIIYLQSGFYWKRREEEWTAKYRGFDKDSVTRETAIAALAKWSPWQDDPSLGTILGVSTRFTTMGQYLRMRDAESWRRTWVTSAPVLKLGTDGKRVHRPWACSACAAGISPVDSLHQMTIARSVGGFSFPHSLPWVENSPENPFRTIEEGISA